MTMHEARKESGEDDVKGSESDERALVAAAQGGDRAARKAIYQLFHERVYTLVFYSTQDRVLAEDLTQTIFLKVFRALPRFRHESRLATWIYRVALNECLNHNRRGAGRYVPLEAILGSEGLARASTWPSYAGSPESTPLGFSTPCAPP